MNLSSILIYSFLFLNIALFLMFLYLEFNHRELNQNLVKEANKKIKAAESLEPNLSILEAHKIMTNTLKSSYKNKKLTAAKMLKDIAKNLKNEKEFWFYHRMRNKIAHEDNYKINKQDAKKAIKVFQEALKTVSI